ncbi:MAG TPA: hypothetical protein VKT72_17515 [Candidatus Baltobacteraceae bacterium]|nr:hypothetical protein [Candidatus Baltobacteraceae bacterium]
MALALSSDVAQADWIVRKLRSDYTVGMLVPPVFESYARLLHAIVVDGLNGRVVKRWRDIAVEHGRVVHAAVQFSRISSSNALAPRPGSLPADDARALVECIRRFSTKRCWFGFWEGYGFFDDGEEIADGLVVRGVLQRTYLLYSGRIDDALAFNHWPLNQTPNLWWPSDHQWCVATEVDLDSTYVGGPAALIDSLLECPSLESLRASENDSITISSDEVNG